MWGGLVPTFWWEAAVVLVCLSKPLRSNKSKTKEVRRWCQHRLSSRRSDPFCLAGVGHCGAAMGVGGGAVPQGHGAPGAFTHSRQAGQLEAEECV